MNFIFYVLYGFVLKSVGIQCCIFRWIVKVSRASAAAVAETEGFSLSPPLVTGRSCLATGVELCYSHALFFCPYPLPLRISGKSGFNLLSCTLTASWK